MIEVLEGLHGTGKTVTMVMQWLYPEWQRGGRVVYFGNLFFSENGERVDRFYQLSDLYGVTDALVGFPELQRLLCAESWRSMPSTFRDLLSEHRHCRLNIIGDTQDLMLIDINFRRHISAVYTCRQVLRIPQREDVLPIFLWISVQKKIRKITNDSRVTFEKIGRPKHYFYSTFWTKKLYDTFENLKNSKFVLWVTKNRKKITVRMVNRELIQSGRVRKK